MNSNDIDQLRQWMENVVIPELRRPLTDEELDAVLEADVSETPEDVRRRQRVLSQVKARIAESENWTHIPMRRLDSKQATGTEVAMAASDSSELKEVIFSDVGGQCKVSLYPHRDDPALSCVQIDETLNIADALLLLDGNPIPLVESFDEAGIACVATDDVKCVWAGEGTLELVFRQSGR